MLLQLLQMLLSWSIPPAPHIHQGECHQFSWEIRTYAAGDVLNDAQIVPISEQWANAGGRLSGWSARRHVTDPPDPYHPYIHLSVSKRLDRLQLRRLARRVDRREETNQHGSQHDNEQFEGRSVNGT